MNLKTTIKTTIEKLSRISETSYPALKWKEKFLSQIKIHTGVHLTVLTIATLNLTKLRVLKTKNCNYYISILNLTAFPFTNWLSQTCAPEQPVQKLDSIKLVSN